MAHGSPVLKLYKSVIEDVIEGVRELFTEEGVDEQVLKDLKQLWETKVMQSKATEGFFRHSQHSSQFTLQLPRTFHGVLQASSGQLYKVNVPVMVTQGRDANILQLPVQQIFQSVGQPSVLHANVASVAPVNVPSVQATGDVLQTQKTAVQQAVAVQPSATENKHLENSTSTALVQQPTESQQQITPDAVQNQHAESTEKSQHGSLHTPVFNSESSEVFSPSDFVEANNSSSLLLDVEGQLDTEPQESLQQQVSDDIIEMIMMGKSLDDNTVLKDEDTVAPTDKLEPTEQVESNLRSEKDICSDIEGIIQLDGTGDASPKEEMSHTKDTEENEFVDIIESEDLKVLEDEDEGEDEEGDSISNMDSGSSSCDNEEPQIDIVEEDPLNSDDDVSEQDVPDSFDTDNVIVCQYDKIHRSKNKWKFYLKDGVMSFEGKDYVFAKAIGDAEWATSQVKGGSTAIRMENTQPPSMIGTACRSRSLRSSCMA
ncbi:TFIIA-alpha and beta-like factor isoform X1 [Aix galericulata]|nr:TFIIA-alpha and beta-like factor isoform X1 [Aix galericulata]